MASEIVLGIDPGAHGGIAFLTLDGNLLDVVDMPNTQEHAVRRRKRKDGTVVEIHPFSTNAPLLAEIVANSHAVRVYCENVGGRVTDGIATAFAFGRARGVIEGVAGALNVPVVWVATNTWKRAAKIDPGKDNKDVARTRAIALWPEHAALFQRKKDVDRAEAALIGLVGLDRGVLAPPKKSGSKRAKRAKSRDDDLFTGEAE